MKTIWSSQHRQHAPAHELIDGEVRSHVEIPERAELVLSAVRDAALGDVVELSGAVDRAAIERVHDPRFVAFLERAWSDWIADGRTYEALPMVWPTHAMRRTPGEEPDVIDGRLAHWSFDAGTPITSGTWPAALASAGVALAATRLVLAGERHAFALCRPPGHHAAADAYGGYCYLNNSAIAAQALRDAGAERVAVLDVDYHVGNGTQTIFYDRPDVLTISLHADPRQEYPFFLGRVDERGAGAGDGFHRNLPMPWGTGFDVWSAALDDACNEIERFAPDALVVPLGVDTHVSDPISRFTLETADYLRVGARIAALGAPTVVVLEGGYATDVIGVNVANVLRGLADG